VALWAVGCGGTDGRGTGLKKERWHIAAVHPRDLRSNALEESQGFAKLGEAGFVVLEFAGVNTAAETTHSDRMFEVEHLVVEQVLDGVARAGRTIEDAADDDGVVSGVVVAERAFGDTFAPGELGAAEEPAEEPHVE